MRIFLAALAATFLVGCQSSTTVSTPSSTQKELSLLAFERAQSEFTERSEALSDRETLSLYNDSFQTARRIDRIPTALGGEAFPTEEILGELGLKAASELLPQAVFSIEDIQIANSFAYVTLQQMLGSRIIVGARMVLRFNRAGEWTTMSSQAVDPVLLPSLDSLADLEARELKSADFFADLHQVLKERSVIYPRVNADGQLEVFAAREFTIFQPTQHLEFVFWINEQNKEPVGAFQPSPHVKRLQLVGNIVPNSPSDLAQSAFFPMVQVLGDAGAQTETDEAGSIILDNFTGSNLKVRLENSSLVVVNDDIAKSESVLSLDQAMDGRLAIGTGISLEEQNIYHWVTHARKFLKDTFNFTKQTSKLTAIARFGDDLDNAFFLPTFYQLAFGTGKVFLKNTALSRDVIIHEFGHSIVFEKYGMVGGFEFSAMNEAMADFMAATITNEPRIAEDAMQPRTEMPYLRTVENEFKFPEDFTGVAFHNDGQIFSGALWDLRKTLGSKVADQLVHEAQLAQAKTIFEFYLELQAVAESRDDQNPFTPSPYESAIRKAFRKHGLGSRQAKFVQAPPKDLTQPWGIQKSIGCWSISGKTIQTDSTPEGI